MVQAEVSKTMRMSKFSNENGVEYAPWMKVTPEDEANIRAVMREKAQARRQRQMQQQAVTGLLLSDSTNQELSGTGMKSKIVDDGNSVELTWATDKETNTRGFLVKRRAAKTTDFVTLASYETYGPLQAKGGGIYSYLDKNVPPGGWFYRISECDTSGEESDLTQCLVEIATPQERQVQTFALAGFAVLAGVALAAGFLLDPVQY